MAMGLVATRMLKLPTWVTPSVAFNNATSWPLLLIQTLETAGVLSVLLPEGDSSGAAVKRAQSYLLVGAIVSNTVAFAVGPRLMIGKHDEAVEDVLPADEEHHSVHEDGDHGNGNFVASQAGHPPNTSTLDEDGENEDEQTSLLPERLRHALDGSQKSIERRRQRVAKSLPTWAHDTLDLFYQFVNAPAVGAVIGAVLGLVPSLHRAFFNDTHDGGIFNAWLTSSVQNLGSLFATLQTLVVGTNMSVSLR